MCRASQHWDPKPASAWYVSAVKKSRPNHRTNTLSESFDPCRMIPNAINARRVTMRQTFCHQDQPSRSEIWEESFIGCEKSGSLHFRRMRHKFRRVIFDT